MSHFIVRNADHALYVLACMLNGASEQAPRGFKVKEQLNCSVDITCPARCIITNPARKLKMKYTAAAPTQDKVINFPGTALYRAISVIKKAASR